MLLGGLGVVAVVLATMSVDIWVDEGEVATLVTLDGNQHAHRTDLWIVDVEGRTYVRAADAESDWLERLKAHPEVLLRRGGVDTPMRAVPSDDPAVREAVSRAMRRKYGSVDRVVAWARGHAGGVPVWLEPLSRASR